MAMLSLMCAGGTECSAGGCTTLAVYSGVCMEHMADTDIVMKGAPHAAASLEMNVLRSKDAEENITDSRPVIASLHLSDLNLALPYSLIYGNVP